jgi:glycolate oxidase
VDYLEKVYELSRKYGLRISMNGHAGDGNIHPSILYDDKNPEDLRLVEKIVEELMDYAIEMGGTITGEHGVGIQKARHLEKQLRVHGGPGLIDLMREIKRIFDPNNIMNPGKYVDAKGVVKGV